MCNLVLDCKSGKSEIQFIEVLFNNPAENVAKVETKLKCKMYYAIISHYLSYI